MNRFILFDPSIKDYGGHYLEYASFVLSEVQKRGLEPILITNIAYKSEGDFPWEYLPLFSLDHWGQPHKHHICHCNESNKSPFSKKSILNSLKSLIIFFKIHYFISLIKIIKRIFILTKELQHFDSKYQLNNNDFVFWPTASIIEFFCLYLVFKKLKERSPSKLALVFRRSLLSNQRVLYPDKSTLKDKARIFFLKNLIQSFKNNIKNSSLELFTDTNELTTHFKEIINPSFKTIPIPHVKNHSNKDWNRIKIAYLGDARSEKGFHFLPEIIESLLNHKNHSKNIEFIIQIYSSVQNPEVEVKKSCDKLIKLSHQYPNHIRIIDRALDTKSYFKILQETHIILLLYDRYNYFLRSSGILAESIGAGAFPIVMSGSWLSRQILKNVLSQQSEKLSPFRADRCIEVANPPHLISFSIDNESPFVTSRVLKIEVEGENIHEGIDFQLISIDQNGNKITNFYFIEFPFMENSTFKVILLDPNQKFTSANFGLTTHKSQLKKVKFLFYNHSEVSNAFRESYSESIGHIVDNPLQAQVALCDILDHSLHFSNSKSNFINNWSGFHNTTNFFSVLNQI